MVPLALLMALPLATPRADEVRYPGSGEPQKEIFKREILKQSVQVGVGPYESTVGLYINLDERPIPVYEGDSEIGFYSNLLYSSLNPRHLILSASAYPMSILGLGMREATPGLYDSLEYSGFNLVESLTADYEEPYALSAFLGNVVDYSPDLANHNTNRGFIGYQFTVGDRHIRHNELIDDDWAQFEWKIEGGLKDDSETLTWSLRPGARWHANPEITDVGYLTLRRKRIDFDAPIVSWLFNAGFEFTYQFSQEDLRPVSYELKLDKKLPLKQFGIALSLGFGIIHTTDRKYSGSLREGGDTLLMIRPFIEY